jgi:hypothetical protein
MSKHFACQVLSANIKADWAITSLIYDFFSAKIRVLVKSAPDEGFAAG